MAPTLSNRCIGGLISGGFFFSWWHKQDFIHGIFTKQKLISRVLSIVYSLLVIKRVSSLLEADYNEF